MTSVTAVMTADPDGVELVVLAKDTAQQLVNSRLTRSQIRNIFTEVRKIEAQWESKPQEAVRRLNMLKPKLDYTVDRSRPVAGLRDVMSEAIDMVNQVPAGEERDQRFVRFMDLFEAILAYHRALGGRN
jgi:CRISPR-associated protein Csm2